ncbi:MAG: ABC transporter ATP-binding protein [Ruminococcus sp.]|nr:ABC transporter ATP-binding protein [Ruminococcus sp.]
MPESISKAVTAENISVGYGKVTVAGGISFIVEKGEILTLIGPNGAGKSTVLKSISAQLPLLGGKVFINGDELSAVGAKKLSKELALVLTERIHSERMTCRDIASTGRYPYTGRLGLLTEEDEKAVDEAMTLTGVSHLADVDFREISDGQRQCVMLARAIAQQPDVLLLDEPTSFLDINHKLGLLSLLRKLTKQKNIAVIQSLHELDLAQRFSDKLVCIKDKQAVLVGSPEEVFSGNFIEELYGIENGSFHNSYCIVEPQGTNGVPEVFVIGGGGKAIPVYRELNRKGIPFAAGIIHENDIEYPAASSLASVLFTENAYEPIGEKNIKAALKVLEKCSRVICCHESFGTMNGGNAVLRDKAIEIGSIVTN